MSSRVKKIVLAYSGGLDTSVMMHWLKKTYDCEVVAYTADVGQGKELAGLEQKALQTGASSILIEDLREEFVRDYVFTALKAGAVYEGIYLMGTSLARPLIAKRQIELAKKVGADAVAHGATGKGNDQVRFELAYYALQPDIKVLAPWRTWSFKSRTDLMSYAFEHDIPVQASKEYPFSMDANLMHISYEGGVLEDPWNEAPPETYTLVKPIEETPNTPAVVEIDFVKGVPIGLNGESLSPAALLSKLNALAGMHGIGRVDLVENRYVGMKSRGVYETPGLTVLHQAHRTLESITLDREVMHLRDSLGTKISEVIYNGFWFSPEFELLKGMIEQTQENVAGTVRLKLFKGNCITLGRKSPFSLYSQEHVTFEADQVYNQADAEGFIKLNALRLRLQKQRQGTSSQNY
jgi:argininosuccinate synthase